jgi:hypothetical protein
MQHETAKGADEDHEGKKSSSKRMIGYDINRGNESTAEGSKRRLAKICEQHAGVRTHVTTSLRSI